jgi:hypothetical protein
MSYISMPFFCRRSISCSSADEASHLNFTLNKKDKMSYLVPGIKKITNLQVPVYNLKNCISLSTKTATRLPRYDSPAIYMIFRKAYRFHYNKIRETALSYCSRGTWQSCEVVLFNILQ